MSMAEFWALIEALVLLNELIILNNSDLSAYRLH